MLQILVALALLNGVAAAESNLKVVRAARMLDPKTGQYRQKPTIVIAGDRIKEVEFTGKPVDGAEIIDLSLTLLPGLIDCHTHLLSDLDPAIGDEFANGILTLARMSTAHRALLGAKMAREVLEAGITTVRDLGNSGRNGDVALRDAIKSGWMIGPRMVVSTRSIGPPGTLFPGLPPAAQALVDGEEFAFVSGVDDARKAVRRALSDGADCIKIYVNWTASMLSSEEVKIIVEEAHRAGKKVAAHAVGDPATQVAVDSGVDSVEHGYFIAEATLKTMAAKGIFLVLTEPEENWGEDERGMTPDQREQLERMRKRRSGRVQAALNAGVRVAFGSDAYYHNARGRGVAALSGLWSYKNAGMPALEVIRTATTNAAELLGLANQAGSIEPGKFADIIGFSGDPLADISELRRVKFVMKGGQVIRKP